MNKKTLEAASITIFVLSSFTLVDSVFYGWVLGMCITATGYLTGLYLWHQACKID